MRLHRKKKGDLLITKLTNMIFTDSHQQVGKMIHEFNLVKKNECSIELQFVCVYLYLLWFHV